VATMHHTALSLSSSSSMVSGKFRYLADSALILQRPLG
jgi:hypothetical protein